MSRKLLGPFYEDCLTTRFIEKGEVIVVNNSDDADEYIFNVGNHVERYDTKKTYRRKVSLFDQEVIDVSLRTINPCGEGFAEEKGISLKTSLTLPTDHVCLQEGIEVKVLEGFRFSLWF